MVGISLSNKLWLDHFFTKTSQSPTQMPEAFLGACGRCLSWSKNLTSYHYINCDFIYWHLFLDCHNQSSKFSNVHHPYIFSEFVVVVRDEFFVNTNICPWPYASFMTQVKKSYPHDIRSRIFREKKCCCFAIWDIHFPRMVGCSTLVASTIHT